MALETTAALLQNLRAHDAATLRDIIDTYTDPLLGAAWGLGWVGPDAEDLVQDTFVTFLQNPGQFEGRSTLKTYLTGILYHKSMEKRRENARETPTDPVDDVFERRFGLGGLWRTFPRGPEDEALAKDIMELVERCAESLSDAQRMAFYLREVDHSTTESACNILGVSATHLGVLIFRARNKIRECVERQWTAPS